MTELGFMDYAAYAAMGFGALYVIGYFASIVASFTESKEDDAAVAKAMKQLVDLAARVAGMLPGLKGPK